MYSDLQGQMASVDSWMYIGRKYKDKSAVRNAAFALGKVAGSLKAITGYLRSIGEPVPSHVTEISDKYEDMWTEVGSW